MTILSSKKRKIVKDKKFMQWVCSSLPCYVCNLNGRLNYHQIQFHHLQGRHRIGAMIRDDSTGIPICFQHHQDLTFKHGERKFWEMIGTDPLTYAQELYNEYKQEKTNVAK
tara:strand:+ start:1850 stop:2182 length:333 start_codon:yes stop_codon:yes gene_type:complete